jgi:hypothetical protein
MASSDDGFYANHGQGNKEWERECECQEDVNRRLRCGCGELAAQTPPNKRLVNLVDAQQEGCCGEHYLLRPANMPERVDTHSADKRPGDEISFRRKAHDG